VGHRSGGDRQLLKQLVHRLRQKIEADPAAFTTLLLTAAAGLSSSPSKARAASAR
jgi:hypothetical protein